MTRDLPKAPKEQAMDRRHFLAAAAAGATGLAFDHSAFAKAPAIQASARRSGPDAMTLDWTGGPATILVANAPYAPAHDQRRLAASTGGETQVEAPVSPRPYLLVKTARGEAWTAERLLPLQGGRNFRDIGGYRAADGRQVRWGKIYRSGVMNGLTPADMDYLSALGINYICDLRSTDERRSEPNPFLKGGYKTKVLGVDYDMASSLEPIARARTREEAIEGFAASYMAFIDTLTPQYTTMFEHLVHDDAPLAFNCSAGKDRTGVGAALILSVLGVPRDTVVSDYSLTQVYTPPASYAQAIASRAHVPGLTDQQAEAMRRMPPQVLQVLMGADPAAMRLTLAKMDKAYGGPIGLVKAKFGVTDAGIARMRQLYLA
jgi:protein-tyrosine phosphatase